MRPRTVLVVHRDTMVAEGITAALGAYPSIAPVAPATSTAQALVRPPADAVALDAELSGADELARRLRRCGARVVLIGEPIEENEDVRVPIGASVSALAAALLPAARLRPSGPLSPQQGRILSLVADGLTAKQVATRLGISHKTVEHHKARIFAKLGVPNQAAAVGMAAGLGLRVVAP